MVNQDEIDARMGEAIVNTRLKERLAMAKAMLADCVPVESIMKYSGLSKKEILAL